MSKKLEVKELNIENLADVLKLQDKIIAGLKEDEKHFILKRSVEDFMHALNSENTHMIGVFDGDKLVAQSIFDFPQNGQRRDMPEFASNIVNDDLVIYKATLVDVDYRGLGLMRELLAYREKKAKEAGKTIGGYLSGYGFNLTFAPVADVAMGDNNIIGDRSFGSDCAKCSGRKLFKKTGCGRGNGTCGTDD